LSIAAAIRLAVGLYQTFWRRAQGGRAQGRMGRTLMVLSQDPEMTPLQAKLNVIATYITKLGGAAALLLFIVLFIKFLVQLPKMERDKSSPDYVSPAEKASDS
jgi:hypothetical protein